MSKDIRYNKSKTYLLPLLSEIIEFNTFFMKYLVNTYLNVQDSEEEHYFSILHDFEYKHPEFTKYEHRLTSSDLFVRQQDIGNQVLYTFKFPDEYRKEYDLFIQGKYSEFGNDAKELILRFWQNIYKGNTDALDAIITVKQVLYKDDKLRLKLEKELNVTIDKDQELGSKINLQDETFNLN